MELKELEKEVFKKENYLNVVLSLINNNLYADIDVNAIKREIKVRYNNKVIYLLRIEKNPYNEEIEEIKEENDILDVLEEEKMLEIIIFIKGQIGGLDGEKC